MSKTRLKLIKRLYRAWKNRKAQREWEETSYRYDERSNMVPIPRER